MKKNAFTLAEVLVTICILGIVAALTLPALNSNISKTSLEKQTLKFYTQTQKAFDLYKSDNEVDTISVEDIDADEFAKQYYNISSVCNDGADCFSDEYSSINNNTTLKAANLLLGEHAYCLQDGMVFSIDTTNANITFDVNGKKGPNIIGQDLWTVYVHTDGSLNDAALTPQYRIDNTDTEINALLANNLTNCRNGSVDQCFGNFIKNGFKLICKKK